MPLSGDDAGVVAEDGGIERQSDDCTDQREQDPEPVFRPARAAGEC